MPRLHRPGLEPALLGTAQTREIAAWWLRRRIFGVFGPGQVYQQTINTLATDATRSAVATRPTPSASSSTSAVFSRSRPPSRRSDARSCVQLRCGARAHEQHRQRRPQRGDDRLRRRSPHRRPQGCGSRQHVHGRGTARSSQATPARMYGASPCNCSRISTRRTRLRAS